MVSLIRSSRREEALTSSSVEARWESGDLSLLTSAATSVWLSLVLGRIGSFSRIVLRIASMPEAISSVASKGVLPASSS